MQLPVAYDELPRICYIETAFAKIQSQTAHEIQFDLQCFTTNLLNLWYK